MKRAIYLDDRERDLARRVFTDVINYLNGRINNVEYRVDKMALRWTSDSVKALALKFEEPES